MLGNIILIILGILYGLLIISAILLFVLEGLPQILMGLLETIKDATFKGVMAGVGIYHLVIFVLATTGRYYNHGYTDLTEYEVLALPIYVVIGIYVIKPIIIYIENKKEEKRQRQEAEIQARIDKEMKRRIENGTFPH